jgi:hypothetical protein
MDCYIVRIYRRERDAPDRIAGTVELVESQEKKPFSTLEQLLEILNPTTRKTCRKAEPGKKEKGSRPHE